MMLIIINNAFLRKKKKNCKKSSNSLRLDNYKVIERIIYHTALQNNVAVNDRRRNYKIKT